MTKEKLLNEIKSLNVVEQIDISIQILINTLKNSNLNETLLINELEQIKKIIYSPSEFKIGEKDDQ